MNTCETCKFWDQQIQNPDLGLCRRYPATVQPVQVGQGELLQTLPTSNRGEWCGEHQVKLAIVS